jgi:transcriptional regulator with XRE-family HTH domain
MPFASGSSSLDGIPSGDPGIDILMRIVSVLRETRLEKKLTLRDLTQIMGISYAHLSRAERGLSHPGLLVLLRWCRALDLKFGEVWQQTSGE